jgi:hypothetical protein
MKTFTLSPEPETAANQKAGGGCPAATCSHSFYILGCDCHHCGEPICGRPSTEKGVKVAGLEPMEYRHAHNMKKRCTSTDWITERETEAEPYTPWGQRTKWDAIHSANKELTDR